MEFSPFCLHLSWKQCGVVGKWPTEEPATLPRAHGEEMQDAAQRPDILDVKSYKYFRDIYDHIRRNGGQGGTQWTGFIYRYT